MKIGTLEEFLEALKKITSSIRIHTGEDPYVEIYFDANGYTNYGTGYEKKVMELLKERTYQVLLFSNNMELHAEFEPELE